MFVRFVAGADAENAYWLTGVFTESRLLREEGRLYAYEVALLEETYDWFNEHLPCPPFQSRLRSGEWTSEAVAWFRDDAGEFLRRIWTSSTFSARTASPSASSRPTGRVRSSIATNTRSWPKPRTGPDA